GELLAVSVARARASEVENVSGEPVGQIIGDWLAELRQHNTELLQARFRTHDLLLRELQLHPQARRQLADNPAPERQHTDDEYSALNDQHPLADRGQIILHRDDKEGADDGTEDRAKPADQRHQYDFA